MERSNRIRLLLFGLAFASASAMAATPYTLSFGGRLTDQMGQPLAGPVELSLKFFDAATGGSQLGQAIDDQSVALADGIFQAPIALDGAGFQTVFGGGAPVFVEVTDVTHGKTYPRQAFSAVPYALRVPVDGATISYNGNGNLTLTNPPGTAAGELVQLDGAARLPAVDGSRLTGVTAVGFSAALGGDVTGGQTATTVTKLQGQPLVAAGASSGDFLKYDGVKWAPGSVTGASGGTVTSVSVTPPLALTGNPATAPTLGVTKAGAASDGYLGSGDWQVFNGKQPLVTPASALAAGSLTSGLQGGLVLNPYNTAAGQTGELRFQELATNGSTYVGLKAPDTVTTSKIWVLPSGDGTPGQLLKTDGSGNLGWTTGAGPTGGASGDLSGSYPGPSVATVGGSTAANVHAAEGLANAATNANTASAIVKRDASGNFSAGTITAALNGNATNVTGTVAVANGGTNSAAALSNNRAIVSSGGALVEAAAITASKAIVSDVNGLPSTGGASATEVSYLSGVTSTIQTQLNGKQATGNYVTALTGDVTAAGPGSVAATVATVGGSTAANVHAAEGLANAATNANTASTIVKRDASGNFSAGTITAALSGNSTNVTGTVAIANGGTGATTASAALSGLGAVAKAGDTMNGGLNLPSNGLAVGSNQLVVSGGNVGIGTTNPTNNLDVTGNVGVTGTVTAGGFSGPGTVPAGVVNPYAGASAPAGWLLCDGSSKATATYPALFAVIGYSYGGSGASFNLPDLRGRAIAGADNMGGTAANRLTSGGSGINGTVLGAAGGSETHTLTITEMPAHNHGITDPGHAHTSNIGYSSPGVALGGSAINMLNGGGPSWYNPGTYSATTGISINNAGGGAAHAIVQPTMVLNYIIKY